MSPSNYPKPVELDPQMKEYFDRLPLNIQELIMQSGVSLTNEQELRQCAENLMSTQDPQS